MMTAGVVAPPKRYDVSGTMSVALLEIQDCFPGRLPSFLLLNSSLRTARPCCALYILLLLIRVVVGKLSPDDWRPLL